MTWRLIPSEHSPRIYWADDLKIARSLQTVAAAAARNAFSTGKRDIGGKIMKHSSLCRTQMQRTKY
jgi:hypothetical protein